MVKRVGPLDDGIAVLFKSAAFYGIEKIALGRTLHVMKLGADTGLHILTIQVTLCGKDEHADMLVKIFENSPTTSWPSPQSKPMNHE